MPLLHLFSAYALSLLLLHTPVPAPLQAQSNQLPQSTLDYLRQSAHQSPDWKLIEPHLPDPATAPIETLEIQGDLLRVRRFPDDALDYYNYALKRGGDPAQLFNKIGITEMELGNSRIAKAYFKRVVKLHTKDPQAWNNLGAVEFMDRDYSGAIQCYKRAIKFNKKFAVSHSNLGMAYVEQKDYSSAKTEMLTAIKLDPQIFSRSNAGGATLHMMTAGDRANFCFQMAKVYARMGNEPEMLHQLQTASEAGMDIQREMLNDSELARFAKDPRVVEVVLIAKSLREGKMVRTVATVLPPAPQTAAPAAR
jgi:tetratricopeptide (TPR) repeat protein